MAVLLVVVGAMLVAVLLAGAGDRLRLPWPVLLLLLGAAAAFVPGIEAPDIEPELILPLFLPPLLYATAQRTSWALFRLRWRTIAFLAIGLVVATVAAVAGTLVALTGIGVAAALALGAAVAPPDPVAVEAVAGPLRVPRRLVATLQSEGLFNDATALVIFQTAVLAAQTQGDLGVLGGALRFVYGAAVAVAIGLAAAWLARLVLDRLTDVVASNGLTLVLPFAVYLAADALEASGVIAVVVAALQLRQHSDADASEARLTGSAFWNVVEMLVTGVAFALIGLELRAVIDQADRSLGTILAHAGIVCLVVIGVRLVWMMLALITVRSGRPTPTERAVPATVGESLVLAWAGMRGLATLALALALPMTVDGGAPFPDRAELVIIACSVLVVTLVGPGLTLPVLIRALGLREDADVAGEAERRMAGRARRAALDELAAVDREALGVDDEQGEQILDELRTRFARVGAALSGDDAPRPDDPDGDRDDDYRERLARLQRRREQWTRLQAVALAAARREVVAARSEPGTDPEVADRVLRRLDVRTLARGL
ncbi:Na+/H+ antiporter [Actinomycetospora endophytica]|uniref:Na+/H+ antiporter n=1 Tax=Actinomycetospora endophytica TaxID=2291215 RepID=A0ABS8PCA6_9PSEU|nr:Na+/H+ antiporter [Actinomycetospora endophytica]MCD2195914.1 Na+/H+ antiporter [Actinomycetospora endophytica]